MYFQLVFHNESIFLLLLTFVDQKAKTKLFLALPSAGAVQKFLLEPECHLY